MLDKLTPPETGNKQPSIAVALIPLIVMGLLLGIGYGVYKIRPQVLLIAAAFITGGLGFFSNSAGRIWNEVS